MPEILKELKYLNNKAFFIISSFVYLLKRRQQKQFSSDILLCILPDFTKITYNMTESGEVISEFFISTNSCENSIARLSISIRSISKFCAKTCYPSFITGDRKKCNV